MPNWDEIRNEWETTKITFKAFAEKHDVKEGTLKRRRSREEWSRGAPKKDATIKKDATPEEVFVESDDLTDKQRLFCIYYIKRLNATVSAIKASYAKNSAHVQGPRLLGNVRVAEEIRRLKGKMQQGIFIDALDVLNKYIKIAFADITDFATFGRKEVEIHDDLGNTDTIEVNYVDFKESSMVDGTIITEVKQGKDGISVKLADKMKALEFLSKHFDMAPNRFKRRLEEKLKLAHAKVFGTDEPEEYEDDGFKEALDATTSEVWGNVDDTATDEGS